MIDNKHFQPQQHRYRLKFGLSLHAKIAISAFSVVGSTAGPLVKKRTSSKTVIPVHYFRILMLWILSYLLSLRKETVPLLGPAAQPVFASLHHGGSIFLVGHGGTPNIKC